MFRAHRASTRVEAVWRLLAPVLVLALLLTATAAAAPPAAASSGEGAAAIRKAQLKTEASMRRADKQVKRLKQQRQQHAKRLKVAKRKLEAAIRQRDKARRKVERAERRLAAERQVLARTLRVHPDPRGRQLTDKPALRKRVHQLEATSDRLEKQARKLERKVERAREIKQARARKVSRSRIAARKRARERAEDKLGARISQMLDLSKTRASKGFATASKKGFRKPVKGTVSQRYGCTGYPTNGRRGSCAHFHDGLDIAAPRGTRVRASADGYVAYVGFNPWDPGSRSFVVIIGHAGGFETLYAHLKPVRKVRAGQRVERGQVIGLVGMTGLTTGPHVHWEVSRGMRTMNPLRARR